MKSKKYKSVDICGLIYTIEYDECPRSSNDEQLLGDSNHDDLVLRIKDGMTKELTADTLNHEILHAIYANIGMRALFENAGIANPGKFEELQIRMLAPMITQALRTLK